MDVAPGICYSSAPTFPSLRDKLWREIRTQRPRDAGGRIYQGALRLAYGPSHFAEGITANDPESFQGLHHERLLVVLDEAPGCPQWIVDAAERMCVAPDNRILAIGNPFIQRVGSTRPRNREAGGM